MNGIPRREWLKRVAVSGGTAVAGLSAAEVFCGKTKRPKLPVAAVITEYRTNSHADVIVGKILEGFRQDGGPGPDLRLVSLFTDQVPEKDLSRAMARKHGFPIAKTIEEAITLGTGKVQVAGVLSIGEHGTYPYTPDTKQHMYPRRRFFDEIVRTFRKCGKVVPVFNDKHLSYRWSDAKQMVETARELHIPFMAGSSLPVTWRVPPVELPMDCEIEDVLAVGYGGLESYGFHTLEMLECLAERRRGGESGVSSVQAVQAEAMWEAQRQGRWSRRLFEAALASIPDVPEGKPEERLNSNAAFYLIEYRDGLKAAVAMANGLARHFAIAVKLRGRAEPIVTWFKAEDDKPYGHFAYLLKAIEHMIHTGRPSYPVERTLLTTGVLDAVMHSVAQDGKRIETPQLAVAYKAADWPFAPQETEPRKQKS